MWILVYIVIDDDEKSNSRFFYDILAVLTLVYLTPVPRSRCLMNFVIRSGLCPLWSSTNVHKVAITYMYVFAHSMLICDVGCSNFGALSPEPELVN